MKHTRKQILEITRNVLVFRHPEIREQIDAVYHRLATSGRRISHKPEDLCKLFEDEVNAIL